VQVLKESLGIVFTGGLLKAIDIVTSVGENLLAIDNFRGLRPGFRILPGSPENSHQRGPGTICEDEAHLDHHLELVLNISGVAVAEGLGTVSTLQDKSIMVLNFAQL